MMTIAVRNNIEMRTLAPENANEVFSVVDRNRNYLRKLETCIKSF